MNERKEKNNINNKNAISVHSRCEIQAGKEDVQNRLSWGFACSLVYPSASVWYPRACVRHTSRTQDQYGELFTLDCMVYGWSGCICVHKLISEEVK